MLKVHKIALDPNNVQAGYMSRACGVARFAYNWALAEWERQYKAGGKPSEVSLRKQFNAVKKTEFPWCYDVTKNAPQQAIKNLGAAFDRAFKNLKLRRRVGKNKNPWGFPKFKKKGIHDSFRADNGSGDVQTNGSKVKLPCVGWVRMHEAIRFEGKIKSAVVSCKAGRWFVALSVECEDQPDTRENQGVVGVDLGVKTMAVCSNGMKFEAPKPLKKRLRALRRAQRVLSRRQKRSANRKKAAARIAKLHCRIACIRSDALHKATTAICREAAVVVLEDLNVKGMLANGKLSRAISDVGLYEFRRQCEYKALETYTVPRFYASSKTCSCCNEVNNDLVLSDREWTCNNCGTVHDRDENASNNLENYYTARSAGIYACGVLGSGVVPRNSVKPDTLKQEPSAGASLC